MAIPGQIDPQTAGPVWSALWPYVQAVLGQAAPFPFAGGVASGGLAAGGAASSGLSGFLQQLLSQILAPVQPIIPAVPPPPPPATQPVQMQPPAQPSWTAWWQRPGSPTGGLSSAEFNAGGGNS
jgi:hypothetical protein